MILIAIGANLPGPDGRSPAETCEWAAERLAHLPGLRLTACSRWFGSSPVPPSNQPDFVNGVVRLEGATEPHALLAALHVIEAKAGRVRGKTNAARTLDLDLLAVDARVIHDPILQLPHPRLAERAFVLAPLCDVAPAWVHPLLHRSAADLLRARSDADAAKPLPQRQPHPMSLLHIQISPGG